MLYNKSLCNQTLDHRTDLCINIKWQCHYWPMNWNRCWTRTNQTGNFNSMFPVKLQCSTQCPRGQAELLAIRNPLTMSEREQTLAQQLHGWITNKKKGNKTVSPRIRWKTILRTTHLMKQLLQFLLQLHKVPGGNQAFLRLVQTVSGELHQLVLNESQHTISQGQSSSWGTLCNDVEQLTLHLGCRLGNNQDGGLHLKWWQQWPFLQRFPPPTGEWGLFSVFSKADVCFVNNTEIYYCEYFTTTD